MVMESNKLSLITCHHCKQKFKNNDKLYTIVAEQYKPSSTKVGFEKLKFEFTVEGGHLFITRQISLHAKCWGNIAGPDYMP